MTLRWDSLQLFIDTSTSSFLIKGTREDGQILRDGLSIDFETGNFSEDILPVRPDLDKKYEIHGVVGVIRLLSGLFLIVVLKRSIVGVVLGNEVYRIDRVGMIPFSNDAVAVLDRLVKNVCTPARRLIGPQLQSFNPVHF